MGRLGRSLSAGGYRVHNFTYHSVSKTPEANARRLAHFIRGIGVPRVHLVAHSLGGLVVLHLFHLFHDLPAGQVVLLGSPVRGSGVAKKMSSRPWMAPLLGRSVDSGLLGGAPAWQGGRALGVIVGTRNIGIGRLIGGLGARGDGTVAVEETELSGATDTLCLRVGHTAMLFSSAVAAEVICFLRQGHFLKRG